MQLSETVGEDGVVGLDARHDGAGRTSPVEGRAMRLLLLLAMVGVGGCEFRDCLKWKAEQYYQDNLALGIVMNNIPLGVAMSGMRTRYVCEQYAEPSQ